MKRWAKIRITALVSLVIVFASSYAEKGTTEDARSVVHLRLPSFALNLHPLRMADVESRTIASLLYVGLVFQDQSGDVRPLLAKEWNQSSNEWDFVLRDGMTFSDGTPVAADDVITSLCAAMQPTSPWAWALASIVHTTGADGKTQCTGLTVTSENRIRIREERPAPWLLDALSGPAGWILPASNPDPGAFGVMPGAGPYKVREIVPDVKVVLEARSGGSPIEPAVDVVQFDYLPDDLVAASRFASGALDVLDLSTPQLVESVRDNTSGKLQYPGRLVQTEWDRIRVAIVNEKSLAAKQFTPEQTRAFIDSLSALVDRQRIADLSRGIGEPLALPMLPAPHSSPMKSPSSSDATFPSVRLTIVTEPDAYSDLIAASMPRKIGEVEIGYKGVEKGILIDSMIKGNFDIAILPLEATVHSPEFWKSFFAPGSPLSVFGKEIPDLDNVDVSTPAGVAEAAQLIGSYGNWIAIIRERRLQAIAPNVTGITHTASGQSNYAFIRKE